MTALARLSHNLTALFMRFWIFVLAGLVGLGLPALWIWIGSQFQGGTAPSWSALLIVHVGLISSLIFVAAIFSWFISRGQAKGAERPDWMQGMTEAHQADSISNTHPLELVIIFAVLVDLIVMMIWFFFFANPGTPIGQ